MKQYWRGFLKEKRFFVEFPSIITTRLGYVYVASPSLEERKETRKWNTANGLLTRWHTFPARLNESEKNRSFIDSQNDIYKRRIPDELRKFTATYVNCKANTTYRDTWNRH